MSLGLLLALAARKQADAKARADHRRQAAADRRAARIDSTPTGHRHTADCPTCNGTQHDA